MAEEEPYEESVKLHALAVETRNFEIGRLIDRNNFFMLFQGVLLAGALQADALGWKGFLICVCGALVSLLQTMSAAGAKFWQSSWEVVTARTERRVNERFSSLFDPECFIPTFSRTLEESTKDASLDMSADTVIDRIITSAILRKYSVSRAPIYVGFLFFLTWLALAVGTLIVCNKGVRLI